MNEPLGVDPGRLHPCLLGQVTDRDNLPRTFINNQAVITLTERSKPQRLIEGCEKITGSIPSLRKFFKSYIAKAPGVYVVKLFTVFIIVVM
jgi:hypothetical protein